MTHHTLSCAGLLMLLTLAGCSLPPVSLTTPEPVKVDINVRLDVYQHQDKKDAPPATSTSEDPTKIDVDVVKKRSRNRMGDIQLFKNNRIVGENHLALLEIRDKPPGEWGDHIDKVVTEENADRELLMSAKAAKDGSSVDKIRTEQAKLRREQSFNGEWIEQQSANGKWIWKQKGK